MNLPGTTDNNWQYIIPENALTKEVETRLFNFANIYGRIYIDEEKEKIKLV